MKKAGIIGSGAVGKALAEGFEKKGYEVMIGSRNPEKLESWKTEKNLKVKTGDFTETAAFGEILVLAVKGSAAENALKLAGADNLRNKTVMDTTNPISDQAPEDGVLKFFTDYNHSLMEILQEKYPDAHFVKVFNSVGAHLMVDPDFDGMKPGMFIAGDDNGAKAEVKDILDDFGWEVEDMGPSTAARAVEPLCILYCIPGIREDNWMNAFKFLHASGKS